MFSPEFANYLLIEFFTYEFFTYRLRGEVIFILSSQILSERVSGFQECLLLSFENGLF